MSVPTNFVICFIVTGTWGRGISKQRPLIDVRALDSPIDSVPCGIPPFIDRLPVSLKIRVKEIWNNYEDGSDCWVQMARTRNILIQLNPAERMRIAKPLKECKPPDVVRVLPARAQKRIMEIWKERNPVGDCWEQQRKTRLILLNLPASFKSLLHPPAFACALPHFIDRLEFNLQVQLRRVWDNYKAGQPCHDVRFFISQYFVLVLFTYLLFFFLLFTFLFETLIQRIENQIRLLQEHDIALESFQMPPPTMFRKYELIHKLKRASVV
uniref:Uncharacterized protein n=1 Tax=Heterorhabditis bacteriophora TaxID=37862 RepID=A0A1I7X6W8_HETBA